MEINSNTFSGKRVYYFQIKNIYIFFLLFLVQRISEGNWWCQCELVRLAGGWQAESGLQGGAHQDGLNQENFGVSGFKFR